MMKKKFSLSLKAIGLNDIIIFEKEDNLSLVLPSGTIIESVNNYRGKVKNHYYDVIKDEFITNIEIIPPQVASFQIESFVKQMLETGWTKK